ncbi:unnamed protein product [Auanema sp. JU1783]|nr:unnamed protein product [Auanema sp. JU1783]
MKFEIPKNSFDRIAKRILSDVSGRRYFRFTQEALDIVHAECESYLLEMFSVQKELTFLFGQETLLIEHFRAYLLVKHT